MEIEQNSLKEHVNNAEGALALTGFFRLMGILYPPLLLGMIVSIPITVYEGAMAAKELLIDIGQTDETN